MLFPGEMSYQRRDNVACTLRIIKIFEWQIEASISYDRFLKFAHNIIMELWFEIYLLTTLFWSFDMKDLFGLENFWNFFGGPQIFVEKTWPRGPKYQVSNQFSCLSQAKSQDTDSLWIAYSLRAPPLFSTYDFLHNQTPFEKKKKSHEDPRFANFSPKFFTTKQPRNLESKSYNEFLVFQRHQVKHIG